MKHVLISCALGVASAQEAKPVIYKKSNSTTLTFNDYTGKSTQTLTFHTRLEDNMPKLFGEITHKSNEKDDAPWNGADAHVRIGLEWSDSGKFQSARTMRQQWFGDAKDLKFTKLYAAANGAYGWGIDNMKDMVNKPWDDGGWWNKGASDQDVATTGCTMGSVNSIDRANKTASVSFSRPFTVTTNAKLNLMADMSYDVYVSAGVWPNKGDRGDGWVRGAKEASSNRGVQQKWTIPAAPTELEGASKLAVSVIAAAALSLSLY